MGIEEYSKKIKQLVDPNFSDIQSIARESISDLSSEEHTELWNGLKHGVKLLDSHELMCQYLCSYGKMHEDKIQTALSQMPLDLFKKGTLQIIDWGCGQGLATMCCLDFLKQKGITPNIDQITLIEPAELTIQRAVLHVSKYIKESKISAIKKFLNAVNDEDIKSTSDITIHFFSNILDIESVEVKKVAELIARNIKGEHYFVCIGPLNATNQRIDSFYNWFAAPTLIWEKSHNKDNHKYTAKYKLFKIERIDKEAVLVPFNPPVQFQSAYQLDGVQDVLKEYEHKDDLLKYISSFEVATPFDIGASIYDDVDPIFAVLNNIIVRGLPTKASPYIEDAFTEFGNKKNINALGEINYFINDLNSDDAILALHAVDRRFKFEDHKYNESVLGSNLEKLYIGNIAPAVFRQILEPQRSLYSITGSNIDIAQRIDFAIEFPYPTDNGTYGCVIELDGDKYHTGAQCSRDQTRDKTLASKKWSCIRIKGSELTNNTFNNLGSNYVCNVFKAYHKSYDESWIRTLQIVLSPIAIARFEKALIEALLINRLNINSDEWNILVEERDVPCAALAIADFKQMFENLTNLSQKYCNRKFPTVNLTIISTKEFASSALHKISDSNINVAIFTEASASIKNKQYDMVIDISVMRRAGLEDISFSDFKCTNECFFCVRSSHYRRSPRYIYTTDVIDYKPLVEKDLHGTYKTLEEEVHLRYFMQMLFRKVEFRPGQLPILSRALQNKSVIGLLPTGGGKSLTYQVAAMLQPGVTLIVDPLRSLMKDQYDGLLKVGIDTCTFINSIVDASEKEQRAKLMEESKMQFVFLSPERLCIYNFREKLRNMHELGVYFAYGVIDEVHCVSEWGHDFRFTYLHLGRNMYNYVLPKQTKNRKSLTLFGLTATASFDVLADVERELSGDGQFHLDADTIVRDENTNRLELQYKIERVPVKYKEDQYFDKNNKLDSDLPRALNITDKWATYDSKKEFLKNYIERIPRYMAELQQDKSFKIITESFFERQNKPIEKINNMYTEMPSDFCCPKEKYPQSGIVFCPHKSGTGLSVKNNAETLAKLTQVGTFMGSSGESNDASETIDKDSFTNLELFRENKLPLMVATKAFGMGIDKPNVRFTINMNYSSSLESFVQEAGRAGRDRHTALSIILLSDYRLVRISPKYPSSAFPIMIIKNKWFRETDLNIILERYNLNIPTEYIDCFTPEKDMVKLRCEVCNTRFAFNQCGTECSRCQKGPCQTRCSMFDQCNLRQVPQEARGFQYGNDLKEVLAQAGLSIPLKNLEYQNVDYETVMYFYNNNFKGSLIEKRTMHELLSRSAIQLFKGNDTEIKSTYEVSDFLEELLHSSFGTELVALISTGTIVKYNGNLYKVISMNNQNANISRINSDINLTVSRKDIEIHRDKSDIAKALYRMCCIGLIDDFTEDYAHGSYRVVAIRKQDGDYYKGLQKYLERYYSIEKASEEIAKVPLCKGNNEVHKCLGYLTEFIYEKIAVKRKRAIDDMRAFCMLGIQNEDWIKTNEELKDFIYYYFNSKYARRDFEYSDLGGDNLFSLTSETDDGKNSGFSIVKKYMRVVDDDITSQDASSQIDNIKHLQGAVRLIRRSLTDDNPTIDLLNVFCLLFLGVGSNENLINELHDSYIKGYTEFHNRYSNGEEFYSLIDTYKKSLIERKISRKDIKQLEQWEMEAELDLHSSWLNKFKVKYII